jgi:geranylgeranyl diphosphate synthase type II
MLSFKQAQELIEKELYNLNIISKPKELYAPIEYMLSIGGKRIRPALLLMTYDIYNDTYDHAINPALAIEIFHNFTLMHDDVMDQSDKRRGSSTVHKKWNINTAILSGDAMLIKSYTFFSGLRKKILRHVLEAFNEMATAVCEGQQYDLCYETANDVKEDDYINMIKLKTAALIGGSMRLGAMVAEAPKKDIKLLTKFGEYIGIAFQLQDDLLDTYGDGEIFGKTIGGDIVSNKKTYLLIKAFMLAKDEQLNELQSIFTSKSIEAEEKIKRVKSIYDSLNIKEHTLKKINFYYNNAFDLIENASFPSKKFKEIKKLTEMLMTREK